MACSAVHFMIDDDDTDEDSLGEWSVVVEDDAIDDLCCTDQTPEVEFEIDDTSGGCAFCEIEEENAITGAETASAHAIKEDNAIRQNDEAEAMSAMYGSQFVLTYSNEWLFRYEIASGVTGEMKIRLPVDYPSHSPPKLALWVPNCGDLKQLTSDFLEIFQPDVEVMFAWAERFVELCGESAEIMQEIVTQKKAARSERLQLTRAAVEPLPWLLQQRLQRLERRRWRWPSERGCWPSEDALARPSRVEVAAENRRRQRYLESREKLEQEVRASWTVSSNHQPGRNPLRPCMFS